jgi:hypothetical protein
MMNDLQGFGAAVTEIQGDAPVRGSAHDPSEVVLSLPTPYMTGSAVELVQTALVFQGLLDQAKILTRFTAHLPQSW